jgi:hypothetical protein
MMKSVTVIILMVGVVALVAGCSSSSGNGQPQPTASPAMLAARNATLEKAAAADSLQEACLKIEAGLEAANFTPPPPALNKSAVDADIAAVDAYIVALNDHKSASANYRAFLDANGTEYRAAMESESALEAKLAAAGALKGTLGLVNGWLAGYDAWKPANDTAGERIKEMQYFASLTDPYHQASPADGIRFFNQARAQFATYLNESTAMIAKTDALVAAMDNCTAKDSLVRFRDDTQAMNEWVRASYNSMVDAFNEKAGGRYGMQARLD